ncbi:MAG: zf-HC2 domain-containing protein [Candidatus Hydrogenedentota bacterium]
MKMTCAEIEECVGAYLADHLTVQERYRVEMHLDSCPDCQAEIDSVSDIAILLKSSLNDDNDDLQLDSTRRETLSQLWAEANPHNDHATRIRWRMMRNAATGLAVAASLMIGSYLGFVTGNQRVQQPDFKLEIASLPVATLTVQTAEFDEPQYGVSSHGSPYGELLILSQLRLPEYGSGPIIRAQHTNGTRAPYIGLPVPRPGYDFEMSSIVHE